MVSSARREQTGVLAVRICTFYTYGKFNAQNLLHCTGVYFSKDALLSIKNHSRIVSHRWKHSALNVRRCVTLAEVVNLPGQFVSREPYFIVDNPEWVAW